MSFVKLHISDMCVLALTCSSEIWPLTKSYRQHEVHKTFKSHAINKLLVMGQTE